MKILFVCSGNTCRSPMAQAMFEKLAKEKKIDAECYGAGITACTGAAASENAVVVLKEIGIDLSDYRSTSIKDLNLNDFDLFVPMTLAHAVSLMSLGAEREKIYLFDKDISDPYGGDVNVYRETRDELAKNLDRLAYFLNFKNNI